MPVLGNAALAVIEPRKFTRYCLDPASPDGQHKARVFEAALGYNLSNYLGLIRSIREGILRHEAAYLKGTVHGRLWRVDIRVSGPRGAATVRTGWIYGRDGDVPRLTTAYVLGES